MNIVTVLTTAVLVSHFAVGADYTFPMRTGRAKPISLGQELKDVFKSSTKMAAKQQILKNTKLEERAFVYEALPDWALDIPFTIIDYTLIDHPERSEEINFLRLAFFVRDMYSDEYPINRDIFHTLDIAPADRRSDSKRLNLVGLCFAGAFDSIRHDTDFKMQSENYDNSLKKFQYGLWTMQALKRGTLEQRFELAYFAGQLTLLVKDHQEFLVEFGDDSLIKGFIKEALAFDKTLRAKGII